MYIATSLDGFIAREDGGLDWLDEASKIVPEDEDLGFKEFLNTIDVLIMGRITFEKVISIGGEWPYGNKHIFVLSRNVLNIPDEIINKVSHTRETPLELCKRLRETGVRHIYVDGGFTIRMFLEQNLVDDITLTTIPILIGNGIPLFQGLTKDIPLKHVETTAYDFGFIQSKYEVIKKHKKSSIRRHNDFLGSLLNNIIQQKESEK